ncbi:MAG: YceI family protein [Bacteroidota bacterium]
MNTSSPKRNVFRFSFRRTGLFFSSAILLSLLTCSFPLRAGNDPLPISAFICNGIDLSISVETNVEGFTCDYANQINDTLDASLTRTGDKYDLHCRQFNIPIKLIDCHSPMMNSDLQEMLNANIYPSILISTNNFVLDRNLIKGGSGALTINIDGKDKVYKVALKSFVRNNDLMVSGRLTIDLNDYQISTPTKFFGLVKVSSVIDIDFNLLFKLYRSPALSSVNH